MLTRSFFVATLLLLLRSATAAAEPAIVARTFDAYVARDEAVNSWTVGSFGFAFSVGFDQGTLRALELRSARLSSPFALTPASDTLIVVNGRELALAATDLETFRATTLPDGVRLDLVFAPRSQPVRVTRSYAVYSGTPIVEAWTRFDTTSPSVTLQGLNSWQLTVPAGTVRTVTGLQGDHADNLNPNLAAQFTIRRQEVAQGRRMRFGAAQRSSEDTVPWFAIERSDATLFGGLMWSGSWELSIDRIGASLRLALGLESTITTATADRPVESAHGFFGLARNSGIDVSRAMGSFAARSGVRGARPLEPRVTYNTWFAYGTRVDEASMADAIDAAARVGVELFVLDAGWYSGAGRGGVGDFTSGLGAYDEDPRRFPSGLRVLAERAERAGMRFGLWVEPERVALESVGRNGLDERWLAMRDDRRDPGVPQNRTTAAQLCLSDARARAWLLDQLSRLVERVQPAYLKWDNNFWINCNRAGHGHGANDGNFAHVTGLYQLLGELRARHPELSIENVSGGGNRLDFGMLRYTDAGWMSDRSTPSAIVRHNLEGLCELFPPSYLLSFALDGPGEPMHDAPDLPLYIRSRMAGVLGLTVLPGQLDEADETSLTREVGLYKDIVSMFRRASGVLLTPQVTGQTPAWDAMELVASNGTAVVLAYQNDSSVDRVTVKPQGLRPGRTYDVMSADAGPLGSATGAALMSDGIEIHASPRSAAHLLFLQFQRR